MNNKIKLQTAILINQKLINLHMALAYITCKDEKEAKKISMHLLKKRLIACANIFPVKSTYWWKNKIVHDKENVIIAKINNKSFKNVENEIKKIHSYKIPCIIKINSQANKEFEKWVDGQTV